MASNAETASNTTSARKQSGGRASRRRRGVACIEITLLGPVTYGHGVRCSVYTPSPASKNFARKRCQPGRENGPSTTENPSRSTVTRPNLANGSANDDRGATPATFEARRGRVSATVGRPVFAFQRAHARATPRFRPASFLRQRTKDAVRRPRRGISCARVGVGKAQLLAVERFQPREVASQSMRPCSMTSSESVVACGSAGGLMAVPGVAMRRGRQAGFSEADMIEDDPKETARAAVAERVAQDRIDRLARAAVETLEPGDPVAVRLLEAASFARDELQRRQRARHAQVDQRIADRRQRRRKAAQKDQT